jgi:hypothetical protein
LLNFRLDSHGLQQLASQWGRKDVYLRRRKKGTPLWLSKSAQGSNLMSQQAAPITRLAMAFEMVKAMQAEGLEWGEGYRPLAPPSSRIR